MSFYYLLLLLSLVIIIPIVFVIREKSKLQQPNDDQQRHIYLTNKAQGDLYQVRPEIKILDDIRSYRNNTKLPESFRILLDEMHDQYIQLTTAEMTREQRFTLDKLAGIRIPEILNNYLSLTTEYAENTIVDKEKHLTSKQVTYNQLTTILKFMQKLTDEGQSHLASNLLISQGYLKSVYDDFYQEDTEEDESAILSVKTTQHINSVESISERNTFYNQGIEYLKNCDELFSVKPISNQIEAFDKISLLEHKDTLGKSIVNELGKLLTTAKHTVEYSDRLLKTNVSLKIFDQLLSDAIPTLLRWSIASNLKNSNGQNKLQGNSYYKPASLNNSIRDDIEDKIIHCSHLLEVCLKKLVQANEQNKIIGNVSQEHLQILINTINKQQSLVQKLVDKNYFKTE